MQRQAICSPHPDFVALMEAMTRHLKTEVPFPGAFDDMMLATIHAPLRVLLAEREALHDSRRTAAWAASILGPSTRLVVGCGHFLPPEKSAELAGQTH